MSLIVGLVGNPNSGKTTVFNALTGSKQRVGNWPGVTIERKSGIFQENNIQIEVIDLPGTYSLTSTSETSSIDERIACEFILNREAKVIVNVLDASNLERNLYLTTQLIEMRVPIIVAVNMLDVARARGIQIDLNQLEKKLGCPIIPLEAHKRKGIKALREAILNPPAPSQVVMPYPSCLISACEKIANDIDSPYSNWLSIRLLEEDKLARDLIRKDIEKNIIFSHVEKIQNEIRATLNEDADILFADARYRFIQEVVSTSLQKTNLKKTWTRRIDAIVLNRLFGIPIFLLVMYCMFLFAINIGGAFQDFFDIGSSTIFVNGLAEILTKIHTPTWIIALLSNGIGKGINTTITFIPVIGAMFLGLAFLEDSGYMARAAFLIDRLMRALGLPGKSFVPMIVGFGCNVPSVMAARTLENKRDRILTVMMSPFMSCSARLAIYAVFTAAFFKVGGQNVVFVLYLIGIAMAMLTGLLLRQTLLKGDPAPLVMELPPYHIPRLKTLGLLASQRLKGFVIRAGKLIVPICVLIGVLNALTIDGTICSGEGDTRSLLSTFGQWITPIFSPMGIQENNWPATVGLVTGILAKEVVVGTLNALYSQLGHFSLQAETFHFLGGLHDAVFSIFTNFGQLGSSLGNPVLAKAPIHTLSQGVYGLMAERFDGRIGAMAYLLFVLLYFPCISTTAAMLREVHWGWMCFSVLWTTLVAYGVAVGFYQLATISRHPLSSFVWLGTIASFFFMIIFVMRFISKEKITGGLHELARN